jgi:flagellar assembly protein FliH
MSSKIHRGGMVPAQTITWRSAGGQSSEPARLDAAERSPSSRLEAQIRDLERQAEARAQTAYQAGRQEGETVARAQLQETIVRLGRSIEEISGVRQRARHEAENDMVGLALAIARRVLRRELTVDPEALQGVVKAALERIDARELHRVRTHPEHAAHIAQQLERIGIPRRVEVAADPVLERGAVVFETTRGALDASVDTQLAEIERGFADLVRRT